MPASRFLKLVKKPAKFQSAVSMCQFLSPGTTLYELSRCTVADGERDLLTVYVLVAIVSVVRVSSSLCPFSRLVYDLLLRQSLG